MTLSEKEKQSYKLSHNRQKKKKKKKKKKTFHLKALSVKNEWHVQGHSRVFHVSRYRSKYTIFDNS